MVRVISNIVLILILSHQTNQIPIPNMRLSQAALEYESTKALVRKNAKADRNHFIRFDLAAKIKLATIGITSAIAAPYEVWSVKYGLQAP